SPTLPTPPPQQSQVLPSTSQEALDAYVARARLVEHLEYDKVAQALEITKLKRRVKHLERGNKVKVLKLRRMKKAGTSYRIEVKKLERSNKASKLKRLKKVGPAQRIDISDDTVTNDVSNQGRMIADMVADVDVFLEEAKDVAANIVKDVQDADVEDSA
nr:hypothetical protein [Tanacetum cinerariifolium]